MSDQTTLLLPLRQVLTRYFDLEELHTLTSDLGIDYDSLSSQGKEAKARELVEYCDRRGRVPELVALIQRERPNLIMIIAPVARNVAEPSAAEGLPQELRLSFDDRRLILSRGQSQLLQYFEARNNKRAYVDQKVIEQAFTKYSDGEVFYRLEHLRLLGFLEREGIQQDDAERFMYRLSPAYSAYYQRPRAPTD